MKFKIKNKQLRESLDTSIYEKLWNLFLNTEKMDDSIIHNFADKEGISPHDVENIIYEFLTTFIHGGKSFGKTLNISPEEIAKSIEIESEHIDTNNKTPWNKLIAQKIGSDHQAETQEWKKNKNNYYQGMLIPGEESNK